MFILSASVCLPARLPSHLAPTSPSGPAGQGPALLCNHCSPKCGHLTLSLTTCLPLPPIRACRPVACPNAGFMARLLQLDLQLHGQPSLAPADVGALGLKKGKPEGRECRLCGAKVLSVASLKVHFRAKHPGEEP